MTDVLTRREIMAEGLRHGEAAKMAGRIMKDTWLLKVQRDTIAANIAAKTARINHLNVLLEKPCADCGHPLDEHAVRGPCYVAKCVCEDWTVIDEPESDGE